MSSTSKPVTVAAIVGAAVGAAVLSYGLYYFLWGRKPASSQKPTSGSEEQAVLSTDIPELKRIYRGKVRDVYEVDEKSRLFVATDRLSAFDVVMVNGIPGKGKILTQMSNFWFDKLKSVGPSHVIYGDSKDFPPQLQKIVKKHSLEGRVMLVRKLNMVPIEAIVRGYITGSAWKDYTETGKVCGIKLPVGLKKYQKLPEVLFTPSTKAEAGHDENISFDKACEIVGRDTAEMLKQRAIAYYIAAEEWARQKGIIIADTKMEFGFDEDGNLVIADEIFTPDCSRFWGENLDREMSYDKQIVRNYLEGIKYDKKTPVKLPEDVVKGTQAKYVEIFELLTGTKPSL
eukprot:TRINITY_DN5139_c0_g1_i1.p1 TRINITY_DN5139_c0_g1~~TRINITY_DN5139_c0_g1_i1.p1  ORF type:complete len:343 (+),score=104.19 TRINITY_DN5139_c0_g1_i1:39-1067(+)